MRVLSGDIGGTKTLLQIADHAITGWRLVRQSRYENRRYDSFKSVLADFINRDGGTNGAFDVACFAVAGPVREGSVELTNLSWSIATAELRSLLGTEQVFLINDLMGAAYGIDCLPSSDLLVLNPGEPDVQGVRAVIGAGTGLGEAWMVPQGNRYEAFAGEGGHVDFAPRNALERELLARLSAHGMRVSYESVLCGAGLRRLFDFFLARDGETLAPALAQELSGSDPAAVICARALRRTCGAAERAVDLYVSIYGAQAANLALTLGATGGLFVVGGIAPKIRELLPGKFMAAFLDHPVMSTLLQRVKVTLILNSDVSLLGARATALRLSESHAR